MLKVVIVNSKGGAGKTTLSTNIASYFANSGYKTTLIDHDTQASSTYWLKSRPEYASQIQSIYAHDRLFGVTRSWHLKPDPQTQCVVVDSPSALDLIGFKDELASANAILIPVLSSTIDVHAALDFFKEMQLKTKIQHTDQRVAIIANRIHHRSHLPLNLQPLRQLINSLGIKFIATLRDSENYLKAYEQGLGIFELEGRTIKKDIDCWCSLLTWLETRAEISKQKEHQEHR